MFVSIVFNEEYLDVSSRSKFYLKNLLHCLENKWILITHEYMQKHFEELQGEINERFFREFEMRPFTVEEVTQVEQYFLPDEFFDGLEKKCGCRTEMQTMLTTQRCKQMEEYLQDIIDQIRIKHPDEEIEGIFNCLESWESVRYICKANNLPLISYVFSAIRKPHGYQQTLYSANFDRLYCSNECEKRYEEFLNESDEVPILSNEAILALIGKKRNLPLLKHLYAHPTKEINVCGEGFTMLPHIYERTHYNDEDIYYECNKIYKQSEMGNRQHPIHLNSLQIDRSEVHNDPAAWILGAKRLVAVCSQIVLKAMLWNRTPIMIKNTLPFSFMCGKDYLSEVKTPIHFLNYYLFGYLIPTDLMFNDEYWKWRLSKPKESEIYEKHLKFICGILNVDYNILCLASSNQQLKLLLDSRNCDEHVKSYLLSDSPYMPIDYNVPTCRFVVSGNTFWRLNEFKDGIYTSRITVKKNVSSIDFYPLDDFAGFVEYLSIEVNGKSVQNFQEGYTYIPKVTGHTSIMIIDPNEEINIECKWKYKKILDIINNKDTYNYESNSRNPRTQGVSAS